MKLVRPVNVQVMSRRDFLQPAALWEFMGFFEKSLPQLRPSVFNWTDPVNKPWNLSDLDAYIPDDRAGRTDTIYWRRRSAPKASGYFHVGKPVLASPSDRWHAGSSFIAELENLDIDAVVDYVKAAFVKFDCDLAQVHIVTPKEGPIRLKEYSFDIGGANGGSEFLTSGLMHWLPALSWGEVFGEPYVRMFGLDRLLSAPAYKAEQLSDTAVYLQLSPRLTDLQTDYIAVHEVRQQVQAHLGEEAFFDERRAYPLRGPMGEMQAADFLKALADFRCPPPGTNGFRTPEFRFLE